MAISGPPPAAAPWGNTYQSPDDIFQETYRNARRRNAKTMYDRATSMAADIDGVEDMAAINSLNENRREEDRSAYEEAANRRYQAQQDEKNQQLAALEAEKQRQFQTSERLGTQEYGTSERKATQEYGTSERREGQQFQTSERQGAEQFGKSEREAAQKYGTQERLGTEKFASGERRAGEQFSKSEREAGQAFQHTETAEGRTWQAQESEKARAAQKEQFQMEYALKADEFKQHKSEYTQDLRIRLRKQGFDEKEADRLYDLNAKTLEFNNMLNLGRLSFDQYKADIDVEFRKIGLKVQWEQLESHRDQLRAMNDKQRQDFILKLIEIDNANDKWKSELNETVHQNALNREHDFAKQAQLQRDRDDLRSAGLGTGAVKSAVHGFTRFLSDWLWEGNGLGRAAFNGAATFVNEAVSPLGPGGGTAATTAPPRAPGS